MIKETTKTSFWGGPGQTIYQDTETGVEYRRIWAGMAWPTKFPGFVVVVGEEVEKNKQVNAHRFRILSEFENPSPSALIRHCKECESTFYASETYGNTSEQAMMDFINDGDVDLYLADAPHCEDSKAIQFYMPLIRDLSDPGRKILLFGEGSELPGILAKTDIANPSEVLPAVYALGYVLAGLRTYRYHNRMAEQAMVGPEEIPEY